MRMGQGVIPVMPSEQEMLISPSRDKQRSVFIINDNSDADAFISDFSFSDIAEHVNLGDSTMKKILLSIVTIMAVTSSGWAAETINMHDQVNNAQATAASNHG